MMQTTPNPLEAVAEAAWFVLLDRTPLLRLAMSKAQLALAKSLFIDGFAQGVTHAINKTEAAR